MKVFLIYFVLMKNYSILLLLCTFLYIIVTFVLGYRYNEFKVVRVSYIDKVLMRTNKERERCTYFKMKIKPSFAVL